MTESGSPRDLVAWWESSLWRSEVEAWIAEQAARVGTAVMGPVEVHTLRFWAIVLRVPIDGGVWWFKENAPSQAFEAALVVEIAARAPDAVPVVVAVDTERGWLLTEDLGTPLGEAPGFGDDAASVDVLAEVAGAYADLQRRLEHHPAAMRTAGVPCFDDRNATAYAVALADCLAGLPVGDGRRLDVAGRRAVDAGLGRLGEAASMLEASGIPDSLEHNDLHPWNAFRRTGGAIAVIDLGDAVWSHPFASFRILGWNCRSRVGFPVGSPEYERIVAAYLEPWGDHGTPVELQRLLPAADRMSSLHRAESWRRLMADVPLETIPANLLDTPRAWLLSAVAQDPYADAMR